MSLLPPPLNDSLVNDDGSLPFPWIRFFNQSYIGDVGTTFKPEFINPSISLVIPPKEGILIKSYFEVKNGVKNRDYHGLG